MYGEGGDFKKLFCPPSPPPRDNGSTWRRKKERQKPFWSGLFLFLPLSPSPLSVFAMLQFPFPACPTPSGEEGERVGERERKERGSFFISLRRSLLDTGNGTARIAILPSITPLPWPFHFHETDWRPYYPKFSFLLSFFFLFFFVGFFFKKLDLWNRSFFLSFENEGGIQRRCDPDRWRRRWHRCTKW